MDEIVLNVDLKFVLATLEMGERGELLTALLDGVYTGNNPALGNVYQYIMKLQEERLQKKQHMRELSLKGVKARLQKKAEQAALNPLVNRRSFRKEAKESKSGDKYNLNLFSDDEIRTISKSFHANNFVPPSVAEVHSFIAAHKLNVDAENFVNFYESHGWQVGSTPIKSWQATVKLWHARASQAQKKIVQAESDDEDYWYELKHRLNASQNQNETDEPVCLSLSGRQNLSSDVKLSAEQLKNDQSLPFARFMHRVEKYDINRENKDDK